MELLSRVARRLREAKIDFVVIGAAAMAVHGVSRSTLDVDLLTIDARALRRETWAPFVGEDIDVTVRFGDIQDPLRGVVVIEAVGQRPVDLIVGHGGWQEGILVRAVPAVVGGIELPVAERVDLVLLKLYAGGTQDLWDIRQLLDTDASSPLREEVEAALKTLPQGMHQAWRKVMDR